MTSSETQCVHFDVIQKSFNLKKQEKEEKGTCSEFDGLSKRSSPSSVSSSFVLSSQRFPADLLTLIVALLRRFWVGLHVSAVEILIGL